MLLQDKIVALTDVGTEADARAHVAQAAANRAELQHSRLEQVLMLDPSTDLTLQQAVSKRV